MFYIFCLHNIAYNIYRSITKKITYIGSIYSRRHAQRVRGNHGH